LPIAFLVAGCATEPSHEGFVRMLENSIGRPIEGKGALAAMFDMCSVEGQQPVEIVQLRNGNQLYRHVRHAHNRFSEPWPDHDSFALRLKAPHNGKAASAAFIPSGRIASGMLA
jgi:ribosomal protein RSM22 (predicted rRNA methylase)